MPLPPRAISLEGHGDTVNHASFFPDGSRLATGCRNGKVRVFDTMTGALSDIAHNYSAAMLQGHPMGGPFGVRALDVLGANCVVSGDDMGAVSASGTGGGTVYLAGYGMFVTSIVALNSLHVAVALFYGTNTLKRGGELAILELSGGTAPEPAFSVLCRLPTTSAYVTAMAVDGERFVTGFEGGAAKVWDTVDTINGTHDALATLSGHDDDVRGVAMKGKFIVTNCMKKVCVWDSSSFARLWQFASHNSRATFSAQILGSSHVITPFQDKTIIVTDLDTGAEVGRIVLDFEICSAALTGDGRIAACVFRKSACIFPLPEAIRMLTRGVAVSAVMLRSHD